MSLKTIGIDISVMLPGGINGGAKTFTIELIKHLAELSPEINYVLLTNTLTHDELKHLDKANVSRHRIIFKRKIPVVLSHIPYKIGRIIALKAPNCIVKILMPFIKFLRPQPIKTSLLEPLPKFDLLFCPFTAPIFYNPNIPTVCTIHDLQYKDNANFFKAYELAERELTFRQVIDKATAIIAISEYTKQSILKYANTAQDPAVYTIYHHMAQRVIGTNNSDVKSFSTYDKDFFKPKQYFIYPANFWKHKNHEKLFEAYALALKKGLNPNIKLICTGEISKRQKPILKLVRKLNLNDKVYFLGFLDNDKLSYLLKNALALIFPSLYEGFGLPVIEAMANNVPVACSNTTALPEVTKDAALLFNPYDCNDMAMAMIDISQNELQRYGLIKKGNLRAKDFSDSSVMAKNYLDVFKKSY